MDLAKVEYQLDVPVVSIYALSTGNVFSILFMYYCLHLASSYKAALLEKPCQVAVNQFTK